MSDDANVVVPFISNLPVNQAAVETAKQNRRLLKEFVNSQMQNDRDFGVIPGTPKPSLFQPGAQKLAKLFNLTMKKELVDKVIDRDANFAMFIYRTTVFHGPSGLLISQCEGSCNSQEKKYRERAVYKWITVNGHKEKKFERMEETPIFDILNTLQKMAQKRSMVGAVIEAVGASDFYTQDVDEPADAEALGIGPRQEPRRAQVKIPKVRTAKSNYSSSGTAPSRPVFTPQPEVARAVPDSQSIGDHVIAFGLKFRDRRLKDVDPDELAKWMEWAHENMVFQGPAKVSFDVAAKYLEQL